MHGSSGNNYLITIDNENSKCTYIDIKEKLRKFYKEVRKYKIEDVICIDETNIKTLEKTSPLS